VGAHIENSEQDEHAPDPGDRPGIALAPVVELQGGRAVAYEVRSRPLGRTAEPHALLERVLDVLPALGEAVSVVPLNRTLGPDTASELSDMVRAAGIEPRRIAWQVPAPGLSLFEGSRMVVAQTLVEHGFALAFESISLASLGRPEIVQLRPGFLFLDRHVVRRVDTDEASRATIGALVAFFSRLGGRLVARGVDDERIREGLLELGVEIGSGACLGPTVVLEAALAEPGDHVVAPSWFAEREGSEGDRTAAMGGGGDDGAGTGPAGDRPGEPAGDDRQAVPGAFAAEPDEAASSVLVGLARSLQREHDVEGILQAAVAAVARLVPADRIVVFEADWEAYRLVPRVVQGIAAETLADVEESLDSGITGWAFLQGRVYSCPDTFAHSETAVPVAPSSGPVEESLVVVPLVVGEHGLGVLNVWRDGTNAFGEDDVRLLELLGAVLAAAWRDAQLTAELERRSINDMVTGLLNMRWWEQLSRREAAQAVRDGTSVAIVLVDLDHFGRLNESLGRAVGDVVLRNAARVVTGAVRTGDAVVRYGDDSFLLLLHHADELAAERVAESVRESLAGLPSPSREIHRLTASIGVALFPEHGETLEEVVEAAEAAMTAARAEGHDAVRLFSRL